MAAEQPNTAEWVIAAGAIVSAVMAIAAAIIAWWSARASERSAKTAAGAVRRELVREVAIAAQGIVDLGPQVEALGVQVTSQLATYANLMGAHGGSGHREAEAKLSERLASIAAIRAEAAAASTDYARLARASDDDLSKGLAKFAAGLEQLRTIQGELKDRLSSLQQKCDAEMQRRRSG